MDIYDYFKSRDIAAHCREIAKVWTPFEMAVIIARSNRTLFEKHAAWRELITEYPDMPTPANRLEKSFESLHQKLIEVIEYEERLLALFKTPEAGAFYEHLVWWSGEYKRSDSVFTSFDKVWADVSVSWERIEAPKIKITKRRMEEVGEIEVYLDYDGNILSLSEWGCFYKDDSDKQKLIDFDQSFYIDIPIPFKRGDLLTIPSLNERGFDYSFVLEDPSIERELEYRIQNCDGSDMIRWGLFADDTTGILYGEHAECIDEFEYYRGKLEGKQRILHYVSLYMNGEIYLPELLTMQCRIMAEHMLENHLPTFSHGCSIPEYQRAENQLTQEEKEEVKQGKALMPWVAGKLTIHHVQFLANETGRDIETVQMQLSDGGGGFISRCAGIVHDENHYEKTNDRRFNHARRAMARLVLAAYGWTEDGWIDKWNNKYANEANDPNRDLSGSMEMPDYSKLK